MLARPDVKAKNCPTAGKFHSALKKSRHAKAYIRQAFRGCDLTSSEGEDNRPPNDNSGMSPKSFKGL